MYFVIKKSKFFNSYQYEIVKAKTYSTEAEAKEICEASQKLNDNKETEFFIIQQEEEASDQLSLPFPEEGLRV